MAAGFASVLNCLSLPDFGQYLNKRKKAAELVTG
jgi:hypothetical protein